MSSYKVEKGLHQLSLTDLFEKIDSGLLTENQLNEIKDEIKKRNPSKEEIRKGEEQLQRRKDYKRKRANEPLHPAGKIAAFLLPFVLGSRRNSFSDDILGEEHLNRWKEHGFKKKQSQYNLYSLFGLIFYTALFIAYIVWEKVSL